MVGSQWAPQEVHFHASAGRAYAGACPRVFGAPIMFGCSANAFVMESEFLQRQVPAADPRLYGILKRYLERELNELPREDDLLAAVRRALAEARVRNWTVVDMRKDWKRVFG